MFCGKLRHKINEKIKDYFFATDPTQKIFYLLLRSSDHFDPLIEYNSVTKIYKYKGKEYSEEDLIRVLDLMSFV